MFDQFAEFRWKRGGVRIVFVGFAGRRGIGTKERRMQMEMCPKEYRRRS